MPEEIPGNRFKGKEGEIVLVEGYDAVPFFCPELEGIGAKRITGSERRKMERMATVFLTDYDV